jgi:fatty acid synthase
VFAPDTPNDRWESGLHGIPDRFGRLNELDRFDAQFFDVHPKQAQKMDPQLRMLLEVSFESLRDAGLNPFELKGSDTGVFVGAHAAESQGQYVNHLARITGYENSGCSLNMLSNRLSFFYDFHGPSQTLDTACT